MFKPSLSDLLKSALRSIAKNKGRTILTSLGIIIGVTSVILLVSIGNGLKSYITNEFEKLGSNFIYIAPGKVLNDNGGFAANRPSTMTFTLKDVSRIERDTKGISTAVIPLSQAPATVKYETVKKDAAIVATPESYATARNQYPKVGRWFTSTEDEKKSNVAVLGAQISRDLFGDGKAVGHTIIVNGRSLQVIGVMDKVGGSFGGPSFDTFIFVPLHTGFSLIGNEQIQSIQVGIRNKDNIDTAKTIIKNSMLRTYQEEEFSVFDQSQILSSITSILNILTVGLSGIAAISLLVGGIGIMNIMLVTVSERTREIGLRKAIGAYPRAILFQFLIEAIILSGLGGLVGVILGYLGTLAINSFFPAKLTLSSVLLAFGVSSLVGIIFGVAPARKASKLSPIEALRYE